MTTALSHVATEFAKVSCAMALLFLLPGSFMLRLLAGRKRADFESGLLSVATSVALLPPLALVLNSFNALTPLGWGVGLTTLCLASWVLSLARRDVPDAPPDRRENNESPRDPSATAPLALLSVGRVVGLGIAAFMIAMAVDAARYGAFNQRQFAYTELWILPSQQGEYRRLTIGVRNEEKRPVSYVLEMSLNGTVFERRNLTVRNEDRWIEEINAPVLRWPGEQIFQAQLYRTDEPSLLYRRVMLRFVYE